MRIILITNDHSLIGMAKDPGVLNGNELIVYNEATKPLDVLTFIYTETPSTLIIDDDYLVPNSVAIIDSIRKVNKEVKIIFVTSDTSIDLGKKISPLGIYYYAIKPIDKSEFYDLIKSIIESQKKLHTNTNK